jgi:2-C-methyl-D-erythritol 4-phosphate cytidylyltransferase
VANGLKAIGPQADLILIHDAARPFITKGLVSSVIKEARKAGAAIAAVPVKATIKKVKNGSVVEKTLDRGKLWEIQTPQVFKKDLILKAYKKFKRIPATDDAMLVERLGAKVSVVLGSYSNIKITTPEDLIIAKGIAGSWKPA